MTYLLDTNVLSELMRPKPAPAVLDWFRATRRADQWLSVITLGELRRGVTLLRRRGDNPRADKFDAAISDIESRYSDRILPVTADVARTWSRLSAPAIDMADGLIAATALTHGLAVVTRNVKDFEGTAALIVNPFAIRSAGVEGAQELFGG
ncbi:type II toxin-antitoxin system VapC family toxin [Nocardia brasiliensis]|uniref:type II toxin-antitoxin system VapC family toxin n=1 Tax=Nocardia brasiliensis TaxID=37326 RepID=UPI001894267C|nr:type II toxin-antitoxin system VapC family toxin [Nocardia brasiliensis]MBF6542126.1 type II toxin-antitoxin system VapC family toxin [Nocardia brasiliensis]